MARKITVIFTDTNKVYGLFIRVVSGKSIEKSVISRLVDEGNVEFIISSFVLAELFHQCDKLGITYTQQHIASFFEQTGIVLVASLPKNMLYTGYVYDTDDTQILQDAVENKVMYLLTHNSKDFKKHEIQKQFGIKVIGDIFDILD